MFVILFEMFIYFFFHVCPNTILCSKKEIIDSSRHVYQGRALFLKHWENKLKFQQFLDSHFFMVCFFPANQVVYMCLAFAHMCPYCLYTWFLSYILLSLSFLPSLMRYTSPFSLWNISPTWLTLNDFKLHTWFHPGIGILRCMV